jgi:hypothetical protein
MPITPLWISQAVTSHSAAGLVLARIVIHSDTSIQTIAWLQTGSGNVRISETDALTVGNVNGITASTAAGSVTLTTGSGLTFAHSAVQSALVATTSESSGCK